MQPTAMSPRQPRVSPKYLVTSPPRKMPAGMKTLVRPARRPRCLAGTNSWTKGTEVMFRPPTPNPTPVRRIASRIQPLTGVKAEAAVKTTRTTMHQMKACLRPHTSAIRPQVIEPRTVPRPAPARMTPEWKPVRLHPGVSISRLTMKPMRNMSKNSDTLPTMAIPMRDFWWPVRRWLSICSGAVRPNGATSCSSCVWVLMSEPLLVTKRRLSARCPSLGEPGDRRRAHRWTRPWGLRSPRAEPGTRRRPDRGRRRQSSAPPGRSRGSGPR